MRTSPDGRGLSRHSACGSLRRGLSLLALGLAQAAGAATIHDESVNGDLSGNRLAPTALSLSVGTSSILGSTGVGDLEYFSVSVPGGASLSSLVLGEFTSADDVNFMAIQSGGTFTEEANTSNVGALLGYTHFGSGGFAGTALTGTDILDELGAGPGSQTFTPPLGSGTYTFWVQQTQPESVAYRLDLVVVPEPLTALLVAMGLGGLTQAGRPQRRRR